MNRLSMTSLAVFTSIVGNSAVGAVEVSPQNCPANRGVFVRMPLSGDDPESQFVVESIAYQIVCNDKAINTKKWTEHCSTGEWTDASYAFLRGTIADNWYVFVNSWTYKMSSQTNVYMEWDPILKGRGISWMKNATIWIYVPDENGIPVLNVESSYFKDTAAADWKLTCR